MTKPADWREPAGRIGFLGPQGTFTEEAMASHPGLAQLTPVTMRSMAEVVAAVESGTVDLGFLPIENSIEGTVTDTLDRLVFSSDLLIQLEVVFDIHLNLLGIPGASLDRLERVFTYPVAASQCRDFVDSKLAPSVQLVAVNSTADGASQVSAASDPRQAAIGPRAAATLYRLEVLASEIEDHSGNQTRFVAVAREGIPAPTGHDRTSLVCFQNDDHPGSLHEILGHFTARSINLTKIESRPTRTGLGDYCFIIDCEGHIEDEVVGDCLRELHASLPAVKFLGSYPAGGAGALARRAEATARQKAAGAWLEGLRRQIRPHRTS